MKVSIDVAIYEEYGWERLVEREVNVTAPSESLNAIPWTAICAGLVESALREVESKTFPIKDDDSGDGEMEAGVEDE